MNADSLERESLARAASIVIVRRLASQRQIPAMARLDERSSAFISGFSASFGFRT